MNFRDPGTADETLSYPPIPVRFLFRVRYNFKNGGHVNNRGSIEENVAKFWYKLIKTGTKTDIRCITGKKRLFSDIADRIWEIPSFSHILTGYS